MSIAQHIRIFEKTPDDVFVEKRTKAIKALSETYLSLNDVAQLLQLAADLTTGVAKGGTMPESRLLEVEAALQAESTSFVREGQDLQLLSCALLAALQCLEGAQPSKNIWSRKDVLAAGLWSGLGFQLPRSEERLESLRTEVLQAARTLCLGTAERSRVRQQVPAVTLQLQSPYNPTTVGSSVQTAVTETIDALRANAALDREELDLLWWVLGGWSQYAETPLRGLSAVAAVVLGGLEAGTYVRRLPGEPHKQLLLRLITEDQLFTLQQVLDGTAEQRVRLTQCYSEHQLLVGRASLFPMLVACTTGKAGGKLVAGRSLKLSDWAARALLESSILHVGLLPHELT